MLPIRKLFGRKSENQKPNNEEDAGLEENVATKLRLSRRHSSVCSTEGSQDPTTKSPGKRSTLLFIRSPFKGRDSSSSCQNCRKAACSCSGGVNAESKQTGYLSVQPQKNFRLDATRKPNSQPVGVCAVPYENGSRSEDEDTTIMNGSATHDVEAVCDEPIDHISADRPAKLSAIERRIRNEKQNNMLAASLGRDSLTADTVNHQDFIQSAREGDAMKGDCSPRLFTKRSGTTTLSSGLQRCYNSFSSVPKSSSRTSSQNNDFRSQVSTQSTPPSCISTASSEFSSTSVGLQNTNSTVAPAIMAESQCNSSDGFSNLLSDRSISSTDVQHTDSVVAQPVTDTPVPPPRRNRRQSSYRPVGDVLRGGTASRMHEGQRISRSTKSRSLSELYFPGSDGTGSADEVSSSTEDLVQSTSPTVTSGILSDESLPSVTPSSSNSSPASSSFPCATNSEPAERCSSLVNSSSLPPSSSPSPLPPPSSLLPAPLPSPPPSLTPLPLPLPSSSSPVPSSPSPSSSPPPPPSLPPPLSSSPSSPASSSPSPLEAATATADTPNSEYSEPRSSLLSSSTMTTTSGSTVDSVELKPVSENSTLSPASSSSDPVEPRPSLITASPPPPSSSSSSSSDHDVKSPSSYSASEILSTITSDKGGSEKPLFTPLRMCELPTLPVMSFRALSYSHNCVGDRRSGRSSPVAESTTPAFVRMSGLTLDHVMTPLRVTVTTEKPAPAVSGRFSPSINTSEIEMSKLANDTTEETDRRSMDHETNNERAISPEAPVDVQCELSVEHCLKGYRTRSLLSVAEEAESSEIIKELLSEENVDDDYQLYELISRRHGTATANQQLHNDVTDDVMALEYEHRPLIGRHSVSPCFHLRKKKNAHIKIVCDSVNGRRRSTQLEIAANTTCRQVIRLAMQTFDMLSAEDPSDYSLIQIDRLTKEINRVREGTMVADLKKDYFLLCKKENLARSHSAKNNRRATHLDVTSCTASHITSPTSPCQWNVGFSRQQLDSVFDGDAKSASDVMSDDDSKEVGALQNRVASLERQLESKERSCNVRLARLQKSLERFRQSALATEEETRTGVLQQHLSDVTSDLQLQQQNVLQLTTRLNASKGDSTRAESPGKLEALEAELQEAEKHLAMTSSEHKELLHVMKNQQTSQRMAAMTSLYDIVSRCATKCYLCHVTVEMSHLRQVKIAAGDDSEDWLVVAESNSEHCSLLPGDRLVELNSRIVCGLGVGEFNDVVTSWSPDTDEPCRVVILRETVETGHESVSLSHDISQWMKNFAEKIN